MKIKFHLPLISAHAEEPYVLSKEFNGFLKEIKENPYINDENNVILIIRNGDIVNSSKLNTYPEVGFTQDITCYDGVTGVASFGGNGFLLIDSGEATNLKKLSKKEIREWVKSNWKEGLMVEWEGGVVMDCVPTRDTFAFNHESSFDF